MTFVLTLFLTALVHADEPPAADSAPDEIVAGDLLAPQAFRQAAQRVRPSLVTIESLGGVSSGAGRIGGIRNQGEGPTTGVVVSADGYIVTSTFNFIRKPPVITVVFHDGTRRVAQLVGRDDTRKICLLKVENVSDLPVPPFVPTADLRVGQWAITVGIGYGDSQPAISAGIISATNRISGRAVQTDANISPANYGGPLIDIDGRVIGICVPLNPQSQQEGSGVEWYDSGIGFAVPLHGAENLLAEMKAGKTIQPGYLGVQIMPSEATTGAVIAAVQNGTPADKAGVKAGDIIKSVDGEEILDATHLKTVVGKRIAGDTVKLLVRRGKEDKEFEVTLAEPPNAVRATPAK